MNYARPCKNEVAIVLRENRARAGNCRNIDYQALLETKSNADKSGRSEFIHNALLV